VNRCICNTISGNPRLIFLVTSFAVAISQGETVGRKKHRPSLDKYDLAILSALSLNTRLTAVDLARRVHLSRTAVSRRITALKRMKVLNDSADVLNYESIGFKVRATVEIATNGRASSVIKPKLLQRPEVLSVSVVAGDGVLSLDVIAFDMDHLHGFIRSVQDDGDTTTKVIFTEEKSQLTLAERMRRLREESGGDVVRA
jgi:Lrp/AsnC family leucine-responsive transcriptional regulator